MESDLRVGWLQENESRTGRGGNGLGKEEEDRKE